MHFWLLLGPEGALGSQIVDLGCQDTDWIGGNDIGRSSNHEESNEIRFQAARKVSIPLRMEFSKEKT